MVQVPGSKIKGFAVACGYEAETVSGDLAFLVVLKASFRR